MAFDHDDQFAENLMQTRAQRTTTGRKDRSGQEAVVNMAELLEREQTLVDLYLLCQEHNADLNDGIKAVAEACGLHAAVVKKRIVAKATDKFLEGQRNARQLALAFEV